MSSLGKFAILKPEELSATKHYYSWRFTVFAAVFLSLFFVPVPGGLFSTTHSQFYLGLVLIAGYLLAFFQMRRTTVLLRFLFHLPSRLTFWGLHGLGLTSSTAYALGSHGFLDWEIASKLIALSGGIFFCAHSVASFHGFSKPEHGTIASKLVQKMAKETRK
ncbi:hypothetical protein [Parasedimentitalea maritima]|uniref:Uncharacterized protein n=1 Tax=Parasedimentitalea maritima TaxID=2578117 RepID=A0A6A4RLR9_9RHOB|nr:hypothetical protein [Zongyanglinia marina]KAE9632677.1 hypothetical protein GP644_02585 [Zongyanglinia marina]